MNLKNRRTRANIMLLITAAIWGFGFVAQKFGAMFVPAFTFNGFRFTIGAISLIPLLLIKNKKDTFEGNGTRKDLIVGGMLAGGAIFFASWLQQAGLEYTNPGKAAFLTACYMMLVPILGVFFKNKATLANWIAVILAVIGIYMLCIKGEFVVQKGDFLELAGAVFWALQIIIIDKFVDKVDSIAISAVQFAFCAALCFLVATVMEPAGFANVDKAVIPILYGGIGSVGIAYTLQSVAQRDAIPSHASLILGSEIVFGTLGGIIFFHENMGVRGYIGCIFIVSGVLISIIKSNAKNENS